VLPYSRSRRAAEVRSPLLANAATISSAQCALPGSSFGSPRTARWPPWCRPAGEARNQECRGRPSRRSPTDQLLGEAARLSSAFAAREDHRQVVHGDEGRSSAAMARGTPPPPGSRPPPPRGASQRAPSLRPTSRRPREARAPPPRALEVGCRPGLRRDRPPSHGDLELESSVAGGRAPEVVPVDPRARPLRGAPGGKRGHPSPGDARPRSDRSRGSNSARKRSVLPAATSARP